MDVHPRDIIDDFKSAAFLVTATCAKYMRQMRVVESPITNSKLLLLAKWLSKGHLTEVNLSVTHLDDWNVLSVTDTDLLYFGKAANWTPKSSQTKRWSLFHEPWFLLLPCL